uniref:INO80 complex subunit E N-terminal domain-containing protein n=1 Tax=Anopheles maculatus TaxID=74869 RepID=A0A182T9H5_9DIPT
MLEGWYCRTMNEEAQRKSPLMTMIEQSQPNALMSLMNEEAQHMNPMISMINDEPQQQTSSMLSLLNEEQQQQNSMMTTLNEQPTMDVSSSVEDDTDEDESGTFDIDYKEMYTDLKKKMKILINENVYFKHSLRSHQKRLLKIIRDRSFLLDQLLKYQYPDVSSSDSDETVESDDSHQLDQVELQQLQQHILFQPSTFVQQPAVSSAYQFPLSMMSQVPTELLATASYAEMDVSPGDDVSMESQMTKEELERHLQSRQTMPQVIPEGELPIEMFNNNSSTEPNDQLN